MAPKSVRDVHPETFIKAYAAHLKANDKVGRAYIYEIPLEDAGQSLASAEILSAGYHTHKKTSTKL